MKDPQKNKAVIFAFAGGICAVQVVFKSVLVIDNKGLTEMYCTAEVAAEKSFFSAENPE